MQSDEFHICLHAVLKHKSTRTPKPYCKIYILYIYQSTKQKYRAKVRKQHQKGERSGRQTSHIIMAKEAKAMNQAKIGKLDCRLALFCL